jgi:two-component system NarL family sensor kinase
MNPFRYFFMAAFLLSSTWTMSQPDTQENLESSTEKLILGKKRQLDSLLVAGAHDRILARTYLDLAWIYLNREGNAAEAGKYNYYGDSLSTWLRDTSLMAEARTIQGRIYSNKGFFASALETHRNAYELKAALRDTGRMAYSLNLMGGIFLAQKKYEMALSFYMRGMKLKEAVNQQKEAFLFFRSISRCHLHLGNFAAAREYALKAKSLVEDGTRRSGKSYLSLARVDFAEREYGEALTHCRKAESDLLRYGSNIEIADAQILLAEILLALNSPSDAEIKARSAFDLSAKEDFPVYMIRALEILHSIESGKGHFRNAHILSEQLKALRDSFYLREETIRSLDFEALYRVKEQEREIAQLTASREENLKELAIREKQRGILVAVLVAISVLSAIFFWFFTYWRRMERKISEKNSAIRSQKIRQLEQQQKAIRLQSLVEGEERERQRLSREIHDSLGGLLSTAKTYLQDSNGNDPNLRKIIDQSCEEVRQITNDLMPVSLQLVGLKGAIEDLAAKAELLGIESKVEIHNLKVESERMKLAVYRIAQESVNNVIKHSSARRLLIQLIQQDDTLNLVVEDDGIGFDSNRLNEGMGLKNMQSRAALLDGEIEFESIPGQGTSVNIQIPLTENSAP